MTDQLFAEDAAEQLRRWDAGKSIWSVEMGGLGPGYEQAIQVLAIEIVRDQIGKPLPDPQARIANWANETVTRIGFSCGGFSGAQVGATKWLAHKWFLIGPATLMQAAEMKDRHIQVSNFWPKAAGR